MRIIIIGEFSGFAKNLSEGFRSIGHECFVFSWGDGFKKIKQDDNSYEIKNPNKHFKGFIGKIEYYLRTYPSLKELRKQVKQMSQQKKWDVVLIMNNSFIRKRWLPFHNRFSKRMILELVDNPNNIFLSACGSDLPYYEYWDSQKWKNRQLVDLNKNYFFSMFGKYHFKYCSSFIHKVIPVMYDYAEAWRHSRYSKTFVVCPTIPLPVNTSHYHYKNEITEKLIVFHGINRPKEKGTKYIVSAMELLQKNYPEKVECIAKGGMPLDEYLNLVDKTNIIIDQTFAASCGMNALYALAMGKVILGGNEPGNGKELNYPNIPVINIGPDDKEIYEKLERLIIEPQLVVDISKRGRDYVKTVHDSKTVAKKYVEVFKKYGDGIL